MPYLPYQRQRYRVRFGQLGLGWRQRAGHNQLTQASQPAQPWRSVLNGFDARLRLPFDFKSLDQTRCKDQLGHHMHLDLTLPVHDGHSKFDEELPHPSLVLAMPPMAISPLS